LLSAGTTDSCTGTLENRIRQKRLHGRFLPFLPFEIRLQSVWHPPDPFIQTAENGRYWVPAKQPPRERYASVAGDKNVSGNATFCYLIYQYV
jgi:hypothetical protein